MRQLAGALTAGDISSLRHACVNDFEPYLRERYPEYAEWLNTLLEHGALCATVTGSGSGFFGLFESAAAAETAITALRALTEFRYSAVHQAIRH
jgi:4-diphosphocytidyl-2C-methyl-D-erythritol kinase